MNGNPPTDTLLELGGIEKIFYTGDVETHALAGVTPGAVDTGLRRKVTIELLLHGAGVRFEPWSHVIGKSRASSPPPAGVSTTLP